MNLIIRAHLLNPPTKLGSFRELTLFIKLWHQNISDILIESARQDVDLYWKFLRSSPGSLDFVSEFVYEDEEEYGLRIDDFCRISPTIQAPYIRENNLQNILKAIKYNN